MAVIFRIFDGRNHGKEAKTRASGSESRRRAANQHSRRKEVARTRRPIGAAASRQFEQAQGPVPHPPQSAGKI